ncbi:unnamed protein product [Rotaria magnacalcarata]|uniref:AB hydrolase-1 domain-containing protein n=1 Tax=Rotaria magnacalcarata TaxID=392030 RepID=A0A816PKC2_9BILA|nr:unnamed protein product [Rotaria magnacalcarata]CAF1932468.1 unnamed protein product [Rotaria magnacalcarata]CAF2049586.1 unnamed protein product [Rotaria magnacalcarata]
MFSSGLRNLLKTCIHTLWKLVQLLLFVIIVPPLINYASLKREAPLLGQHGLPYDIGFGQKLFLRCRGKGAPTVIFDAPTGMTSDIWFPLQENLQKTTTVCIYDRAGLGMSDPPLDSTIQQKSDVKENESTKYRGMDFTVEKMSEDLNRLMTATSQQPKPFILVGADLGAIVARFYTQMYEFDVSHLFLIDPLVENLFDNEHWKDHWYNKIIPRLHAMQLSAAMGVNRILVLTRMINTQLSTTAFNNIDDTNININHRQKHLLCNAAHISSAIREHFYMNETFSQMKLAWRMKAFSSNTSVTIVNRRQYDKDLSKTLNQAWDESQEFLRTQLFRNRIQHRLIDSTDKYFFFNKPDLLESIIKDSINQWREQKGLA